MRTFKKLVGAYVIRYCQRCHKNSPHVECKRYWFCAVCRFVTWR